MNRKNTSITPTASEMEAALRAAPDPDNPPFPDDFMERAFRTSSSGEMLEKLAEIRQQRTGRAAAGWLVLYFAVRLAAMGALLALAGYWRVSDVLLFGGIAGAGSAALIAVWCALLALCRLDWRRFAKRAAAVALAWHVGSNVFFILRFPHDFHLLTLWRGMEYESWLLALFGALWLAAGLARRALKNARSG
ncbi:MAG: hypothetical protein IKH84_01650 [Ottowia sp.]|nr:hypothetical protein [Ottowia sp.]